MHARERRGKLRMALVGGGGAGFIGKVHATAAQLDRQAELVAGAFSSDPQRSREAAEAFGVSTDRAYASYQQLLAAESQLPPDTRADFISIATPNYLHFPIAKAALEAGFAVFCEKPLTTNLNDAEQLAKLVHSTRSVFVLLHNYTGYPLIRQLRQMIADGALGEVQAVRVNYIQGGLRGLQPGTKPARGAWKSDPEQAGPAGTLGDIGTHAYQLARYVTGLKPLDLSCRLATFTPGRQLDDYGHALVRFEGGSLGMITFSQATHGRLNDLTLEIDGSLASAVWRQEFPNQLELRRFGEPMRTYERFPAAPYTNEPARSACRLPAGHPEGFLEAFANVFRAGFDDLRSPRGEQDSAVRDTVYPNVYDGVEGVYFIEQCLASQRADGARQTLDHPLRR